MPSYSGAVEFTGSSYMEQVPVPSSISYSAKSSDVILASATPNSSGDTDNINVGTFWDQGNAVWYLMVSDSAYIGNVSFRIVYEV